MPKCRRLWILFGIVSICKAKFVSELANDNNSAANCDRKSSLWNQETHESLQPHCASLSYEQHCVVQNFTVLDCLVRRSLMHDLKSCGCHTNYTSVEKCIFVEVCAFVDPNFNCHTDYQCDVNETDFINCFAPGERNYSKECTRGLIFCPQCDMFTVCEKFPENLKGECGQTYQEIFGINKTVYFVDRVHFNGHSSNFKQISTVMRAAHDMNNACDRSKICVSLEEISPKKDWIISVSVFVGVIILIVMLSSTWVACHKRSKWRNRWTRIKGRTMVVLGNFMHSDSGANLEVQPPEIAEEADAIFVTELIGCELANEDYPALEISSISYDENCRPGEYRKQLEPEQLFDNDSNHPYSSSDSEIGSNDDLPLIYDSEEDLTQKSKLENVEIFHPERCSGTKAYENTTYGQHSVFEACYIAKSDPCFTSGNKVDS